MPLPASPPPYLSDAEVLAAIEKMPPGDWKKLDRWCRDMWPADPMRLWDATFERIDPKKRDPKKTRYRRLRADRPVVVGLYWTMRSVRTDFIREWYRDKEERDKAERDKAVVGETHHPPHDDEEAEQQAQGNQEDEEREQFVEWFQAALERRIAENAGLLAGLTGKVRAVAEGIQQGRRGEELCQFAGVTKNELATIRRMISRRKTKSLDEQN